ncbi:MAG: glycosyl hydrolase [Bacteroidota bacterium]
MRKYMVRIMSILAGMMLLGLIMWVSTRIHDMSKSLDFPPHSLSESETDSVESIWSVLDPLPDTTISRYSLGSRPLARWIWPTQSLDRLALLREMRRMQAQGWGGAIVIPQHTGASSFPLHMYVDFIADKASKSQFVLELNLSDGILPGDSKLPPEQKLNQILFGEAHILGGKKIEIPVPQPNRPLAYYLNGWQESTVDPNQRKLRFESSEVRLLSVLAAKPLKEQRTSPVWDLTDQTSLQADSLFLLKGLLDSTERLLTWDAPPGYWKIISLYEVPLGEIASQHVYADQEAINWFDQEVVETQLPLLFQNFSQDSFIPQAIQGIFLDRFDNQANSYSTQDLRRRFKEDKGYDLWPWLPIILEPGRYNTQLQRTQLLTKPPFTISESDERVREDYAQFMSDLFLENTVGGTEGWAHGKQLHTRLFPEGWEFDVITAAKYVDIPHVDQQDGGGSSLWLKTITSGAILAGTPIVSGELLTRRLHHPQLTAQEIRIGIDRLWSQGVNQLIWSHHEGSPPVDAQQKASPSSLPSSQPTSLSPTTVTQLNTYIQQSQHILQQGKSIVDVAVYYPFMGFPMDFEFDTSHEELFFNGHVPFVNLPDIPLPYLHEYTTWLPREADLRIKWLKEVWTLLKELEDQGLNWIWVNDHYLQRATWANAQMKIGQTDCQVLLLPEIPYMDVEAAKSVAQLADSGAKIVAYGNTPTRAKGYYRAEEKDAVVQESMKAINIRTTQLDPKELRNLIEGIYVEQTISFDDSYTFLRRQGRKMGDTTEAHFLQNISPFGRTFLLEVDPSFEQFYWVHAGEGTIIPVEPNDDLKIKGFLDAYNAILLLATHNPLPDSMLSPMPFTMSNPLDYRQVEWLDLDKWDIALEGQTKGSNVLSLQDTTLINGWKLDERELPREIYYTTSIELGKLNPDYAYILDLGRVNSQAEVLMNTQALPSLIQSPYRLDLTPYVSDGINTLEIWVQSPPWQHLPQTTMWKGEETAEAIPVGLLGPVKLYIIEKN